MAIFPDFHPAFKESEYFLKFHSIIFLLSAYIGSGLLFSLPQGFLITFMGRERTRKKNYYESRKYFFKGVSHVIKDMKTDISG